jgi:hypothetical protein
MPPMFTVEERDRVRDRILALAQEDSRVVAGAMIGSMAQGNGDRWSDLDLGFGVADGVPLAEVLDDWTATLERELDAAHLFDLERLSSIYRVFLFPGCLQVDLSFTPASEFGALGPRFRVLFGQAVERSHLEPPTAQYLFGMGAHHAVRAHSCVVRGRLWQAEYWISELRHLALSLACHRRGLEAVEGRGYEQLPAEVLKRFEGALVRSVDGEELLRALERAIGGLLQEADEVPELASKVQAQLRALVAPE